MLKLTGSFGEFALIGGDRRVLDLNLEPTRQLFREVAIKKTDVTLNELGIYSFINVGRFGKAKMNSLTVPKHLLQSRKGCLTWNPKGRMYMKPDEISTEPVEYMGEQCSDALMGECLEAVLGTGNQIRDIFATPEGAALFQEAIGNIFLGLGNSLYDLVTYGMDSVITSSDTGNWWNTATTSTEEWDDFVDQQLGVGVKGHIPLIEQAKADGLANFNVEIIAGDVSGSTYTGGTKDVVSLFEEVIAAAPSRLRILRKKRGTPGVVMLVSTGIFDAYKDYLITNWNTIPDVYKFMLEGEAVPGVLYFDGTPVVCMDEWREFDELVGINTHRVVLTAVKNFVIAHDVPALNQFGGIGMRIEQSQELKNKGIVHMYTNFQVGAGIADTDFMVNASRILTP